MKEWTSVVGSWQIIPDKNSDLTQVDLNMFMLEISDSIYVGKASYPINFENPESGKNLLTGIGMGRFMNNIKFLYNKHYNIKPILKAWDKIKHKGKFYLWLEYQEWDSKHNLLEENMHEILIFDPDKEYPEHKSDTDIVLTVLFDIKDVNRALKYYRRN